MREAVKPFPTKSIVPSSVSIPFTTKSAVTENVLSDRTQVFVHVLVSLLVVMRISTKLEPYLALKLRVNAAFVAEMSAYMPIAKWTLTGNNLLSVLCGACVVVVDVFGIPQTSAGLEGLHGFLKEHNP